jgi:hypothetical protein
MTNVKPISFIKRLRIPFSSEPPEESVPAVELEAPEANAVSPTSRRAARNFRFSALEPPSEIPPTDFTRLSNVFFHEAGGRSAAETGSTVGSSTVGSTVGSSTVGSTVGSTVCGRSASTDNSNTVFGTGGTDDGDCNGDRTASNATARDNGVDRDVILF